MPLQNDDYKPSWCHIGVVIAQLEINTCSRTVTQEDWKYDINCQQKNAVKDALLLYLHQQHFATMQQNTKTPGALQLIIHSEWIHSETQDVY